VYSPVVLRRLLSMVNVNESSEFYANESHGRESAPVIDISISSS
jgi:hypothetical protein